MKFLFVRFKINFKDCAFIHLTFQTNPASHGFYLIFCDEQAYSPRIFIGMKGFVHAEYFIPVGLQIDAHTIVFDTQYHQVVFSFSA